MISKEDFVQWRNQGVTQEYKAAIMEAISNLGAELVNRESPDIHRDQFVRGFIKGLIEAVEWEPAFPKDELIVDQEEA